MLGICRSLIAFRVTLYFRPPESMSHHFDIGNFDIEKFCQRLPQSLKALSVEVCGYHSSGHSFEELKLFALLSSRLPNLEVLLIRGFRVTTQSAVKIIPMFRHLKCALCSNWRFELGNAPDIKMDSWKWVVTTRKLQQYADEQKFNPIWKKAVEKYF
jgi:hypothetical protein